MKDSDIGPRHVVVAGCGYVGQSLAGTLSRDGVRVTGVKRHPSGLPDGVEALAADVLVPAALTTLPKHPDAVVYAVSPSERSGTAYRNAYVEGLRNVLHASGTKDHPYQGRLILVSSTGVYGHTDGAWVDENSPPNPANEPGAALLEGEELARGFGGVGTVLRLGGIYGPGRDRTVRRIATGQAECPDPDRFGNRIHRDDAAAAARHLLRLENPDELYLGVDRDPAPLRDVYQWVAERLGVSDPCLDRGERPKAPSRSRTRPANKRCSSQRLIESGFRFRFPTFREGYLPFIEALQADPEP